MNSSSLSPSERVSASGHRLTGGFAQRRGVREVHDLKWAGLYIPLATVYLKAARSAPRRTVTA